MSAINLASYACTTVNSRGRKYSEAKSQQINDCYQVDVDRIIHCTAFRRLEYKTQVFINFAGDLFRTRLTHSIEVSQVARQLARALQLNESLTEGLGLAHDLGHPPFGHVGQEVLNQLMQQYGGFEHNWQSLRVVDILEDSFADFPGLNLSFEMREGILKHCSLQRAKLLEQIEPNGVAQRFINNTAPSLEAQVADIADSIAYNTHDIDDGWRHNIFTLEQLLQSPLFGEFLQQTKQQYSNSQPHYWIHSALRQMRAGLISDVVQQTKHNLQQYNISSIQQVRQQTKYLVSHSIELKDKIGKLKKFLMQNMYRNQKIHQSLVVAQDILRQLFAIYANDYRQMSADFIDKIQQADNDDWQIKRVIADYIAGMTDRFAFNEHRRLTTSS